MFGYVTTAEAAAAKLTGIYQEIGVQYVDQTIGI